MFRTHLMFLAALKLILMPQGALEDGIHEGDFYIGLGDQFDDDRRRVRALRYIPLG